MSCWMKTSADAPSESSSRLHPTTPSSDSAHNSQSLPRQISPPPNPGLHPAAHSPAQSFPSHLSPCNHFPSFHCPRPPSPPSHRRSRCPPPAQSAPPHNSRRASQPLQTLLLAGDLPQVLSSFLLPTTRITPQPPRPTPAATSASHRESSHPPEIAGWPHRSTHTPALAPPPAPPPSETPATRAAGEIAQSPPSFSSPSPRSTHSPAPPRPSPATAAASALSPPPPRTRFPSSSPPPAAVSHALPASQRCLPLGCNR